jgi:hypothetical protein
MYIIGITPGAYTLGRAAGTEIARELSGIAEKIAFGYTAGCNFFQIDQEAFGEFLDPFFIDKLIALIEKMNVEWALHGFVLSTFYQSLDSTTNPEWKTANLILHRDLTFLYEILLKLKERNVPKAFPHYTIYHSSREYIIGYGIVTEKGRVEANTVNPFGERSWIEILENKNREKLLNWFKENLLPILYDRFPLIRKEESFFSEFFRRFLSSFTIENEEIKKDRLKKFCEIIVDFLNIDEKIKNEIDKICDESIKEVVEKIFPIEKMFGTILLKEILNSLGKRVNKENLFEIFNLEKS